MDCAIWLNRKKIFTADEISANFSKETDPIYVERYYLPETDAALRSALEEETKEAVTVIVAQRVGTIMNADQIIVLDHGQMMGKGKHKELLKTCPTYREIAYSQLPESEVTH